MKEATAVPGPAMGKAIIKVNNTATKRTRNRVKEGGPVFEFFDNAHARPGELLLRSPKTQWLGWLPISEIDWKLDI